MFADVPNGGKELASSSSLFLLFFLLNWERWRMGAPSLGNHNLDTVNPNLTKLGGR